MCIALYVASATKKKETLFFFFFSAGRTFWERSRTLRTWVSFFLTGFYVMELDKMNVNILFSDQQRWVQALFSSPGPSLTSAVLPRVAAQPVDGEGRGGLLDEEPPPHTHMG